MKKQIFKQVAVYIFIGFSYSLFGQCGSVGGATLIDWAHQAAGTPGQMQYGAFVPGGGTYDESGTFTTTCSSPLTMTMDFTRNSGTSNGIAGLDYRIEQNATSTSTFTISFSIPVIIEDFKILDIDMNSTYHDNLVFLANYNGNDVPVTLNGNSFVNVNTTTQTVSAISGSPVDLGEVTVSTSGAAVSEISFEYTSLSGTGQQFLLVQRNLQTCCPNPLPVELTNFSIDKNLKSVDIDWTTASERNNDYFVIERSEDALNWQELVKIQGAGNSSSPLNYSFTDEIPLRGTSYYRLVQYDFDGSSTISDVESIRLEIESSIDIFPNPLKDEQLFIGLGGFKNDLIYVSIIDMAGNTLCRDSFQVNSSSEKIKLSDISNLNPGMYIICILTEDKMLSEKLIVE